MQTLTAIYLCPLRHVAIQIKCTSEVVKLWYWESIRPTSFFLFFFYCRENKIVECLPIVVMYPCGSHPTYVLILVRNVCECSRTHKTIYTHIKLTSLTVYRANRFLFLPRISASSVLRVSFLSLNALWFQIAFFPNYLFHGVYNLWLISVNHINV